MIFDHIKKTNNKLCIMETHIPSTQAEERAILKIRTQSSMEPASSRGTCDMCTSLME